MTRDFRRLEDPAAFFFRAPAAPGGPPKQLPQELRQRVIELRKANLSVPDIKARLDAETGEAPGLRVIGNLLRAEGFARLPRRTRADHAALAHPGQRSARPAGLGVLPLRTGRRHPLPAALDLPLRPAPRHRTGRLSGHLHAARPAVRAGLRGSQALRRPTPQRRRSVVHGPRPRPVRRPQRAARDCLPVRLCRPHHPRHEPEPARLPGSTRTAERLAKDSANLDFTTLPHWGDDKTLQKHWSGTRGRSLVSLSAALAQDPDSGLLLYTDAGVRRPTSDGVVLEFLEFSRRPLPRLRLPLHHLRPACPPRTRGHSLRHGFLKAKLSDWNDTGLVHFGLMSERLGQPIKSEQGRALAAA